MFQSCHLPLRFSRNSLTFSSRALLSWSSSHETVRIEKLKQRIKVINRTGVHFFLKNLAIFCMSSNSPPIIFSHKPSCNYNPTSLIFLPVFQSMILTPPPSVRNQGSPFRPIAPIPWLLLAGIFKTYLISPTNPAPHEYI